MKMNLQLFAGGHSVTVIGDAGVSSASASSSSDVQKNAEVTLTVTLGSGKEVKEYEVLKGGVTVDPATKKFTMGEADVVIVIHTRGTGDYRVVENCFCSVNGTVTKLQRNMELVYGVNGAVVNVKGTDTTINLSADLLANLIASGVIIKI